uniref:AAA+ ATPase At3g28540-like C-terminal domain-containing protein n=1 Tax=Cajanus cajan TaxID=3821 RepID=A0A151UFJ4_CAJCA
MDMHIHMSYCSYQGFKLLASNYLQTPSDHPLFGEIEGLIEDIQITPAQVAEELMKDEDADATLEGFVKLLKRKKMEGDVCENNSSDKTQPKRRKLGGKQKRGVGTQRRTRRIRRGSSL